jgi:hypothetical protein
VVAIGECAWARVCAFGRACMSEWGACGRVCCRDVVSLCGQAYITTLRYTVTPQHKATGNQAKVQT